MTLTTSVLNDLVDRAREVSAEIETVELSLKDLKKKNERLENMIYDLDIDE